MRGQLAENSATFGMQRITCVRHPNHVLPHPLGATVRFDQSVGIVRLADTPALDGGAADKHAQTLAHGLGEVKRRLAILWHYTQPYSTEPIDYSESIIRMRKAVLFCFLIINGKRVILAVNAAIPTIAKGNHHCRADVPVAKKKSLLLPTRFFIDVKFL